MCSIDSSELLSENSCERESEIDIEEEKDIEMDALNSNCCNELKNKMPENPFLKIIEASE